VKRWWRWIGLFLASVLTVASFGALVIATQSKSQAHSSLEDAIRLRQARLHVARAQRALGGSDIGDAVVAGRKANAIALRVGSLTERIVDLLRPLRGSTEEAVEQGRRGIRNAVVAREQTRVAAEILGAIAGYQRSAVADADLTNRALRRILAALRETNESIP
jgi:hypothetical protein